MLLNNTCVSCSGLRLIFNLVKVSYLFVDAEKGSCRVMILAASVSVSESVSLAWGHGHCQAQADAGP